jgi:hypothetical protein
MAWQNYDIFKKLKIILNRGYTVHINIDIMYLQTFGGGGIFITLHEEYLFCLIKIYI